MRRKIIVACALAACALAATVTVEGERTPPREPVLLWWAKYPGAGPDMERLFLGTPDSRSFGVTIVDSAGFAAWDTGHALFANYLLPCRAEGAPGVWLPVGPLPRRNPVVQPASPTGWPVGYQLYAVERGPRQVVLVGACEVSDE